MTVFGFWEFFARRCPFFNVHSIRECVARKMKVIVILESIDLFNDKARNESLSSI